MRRNRAELFKGDPPGKAWCSGHNDGAGGWVAREQFNRDGSKRVQSYCRTCRAAYMRDWRRHGLPAKQRDAYAREQLAKKPESGLEALAAKYANR
jgi:hypothetical protein